MSSTHPSTAAPRSTDEAEMEHVDPAAITLWRVQAMLFALAISVGAAAAMLRVSAGAAGMTGLLALAFFGGLAWMWPRAYYDALTYGVDEIGITIARGVAWRSRIAVPRARIQHTDISQGPLERRLDIATLKLYTAGSRYTQTQLPGLSHERAVELRDALLGRDGSGV